MRGRARSCRSAARLTAGVLAAAALAGGSVAGTASAAVCRGVEFPASVRAAGTTLALHGLGVRKATFLRINVYVAALYLSGSGAASGTGTAPGGATLAGGDARKIIRAPGPWELVLHFVRGVSAREIRGAFSDAFAEEGNGRVPTALAARVATLNRSMQGMRSGEAMTFLRLPGRGVQLDIGGLSRGVIPGEDFAHALLAIWLGEHPPNPELKRGLLGGPCG
ncbi:MAG: chalcone isomerase family protein [Steroidobacteraceae bacterium]